jgi:hypothetical protein
VSVVYDAAVLVAADRYDRRMWAEHRARLELGVVPATTAPVVAQVSRSPQQAQLHRFLRGCAIMAFDADDWRPVGQLLAAASTTDVVDAHVVLIAARRGLSVLTGDPDDLSALAVHLPVAITRTGAA